MSCSVDSQVHHVIDHVIVRVDHVIDHVTRLGQSDEILVFIVRSRSYSRTRIGLQLVLKMAVSRLLFPTLGHEKACGHEVVNAHREGGQGVEENGQPGDEVPGSVGVNPSRTGLLGTSSKTEQKLERSGRPTFLVLNFCHEREDDQRAQTQHSCQNK